MTSHFFPAGSWKAPLIQLIGKNLKQNVKRTTISSQPIHFIQADGQLKAKEELFVTFEFFKQEEMSRPASMEYFYLELSYMVCSLKYLSERNETKRNEARRNENNNKKRWM